MKRIMLLAGLCLALTATMRAQVVQKRETSDQAQQQLLQLNDEMAASFHHTDLLKVSEYFDDDATIYIDGNKVTTYTIQQDYYWMMGDNRNNSADSRFWGFVPEDHIVGHASFIWMSIDQYKGMFGGGMRWSRMFSGIE